jgi:deoxyinosine 3'endonuclease (endonuclease V)
MIYCFDTFYTEDLAHTAVVGIKNWNADKADFELDDVIHGIGAYESGAFYKRELPCLKHIIAKIDLDPANDVLVIDGYVVLSDDGKLGLGGYLFEELRGKTPVIGVAKNNFHALSRLKREIFRGGSSRPLFVTAMGIDLEEAKNRIIDMSGTHRIPTILKLVDQKSRNFK